MLGQPISCHQLFIGGWDILSVEREPFHTTLSDLFGLHDRMLGPYLEARDRSIYIPVLRAVWAPRWW
jgi:hypothetical protein